MKARSKLRIVSEEGKKITDGLVIRFLCNISCIVGRALTSSVRWSIFLAEKSVIAADFLEMVRPNNILGHGVIL